MQGLSGHFYGRRRRPKSFWEHFYRRRRRRRDFFGPPYKYTIVRRPPRDILLYNDEDGDDFDVEEDEDEVTRQHLALVEAHAHLFNQV